MSEIDQGDCALALMRPDKIHNMSCIVYAVFTCEVKCFHSTINPGTEQQVPKDCPRLINRQKTMKR